MNINSRFAGVSRAARSLIGSTSADALAAAETPAAAAVATEPAPAGDPSKEPVVDEPVDDVVDDPADEPADEPAGKGGAPAAEALSGDAKIRADERTRVSTVFASEHATGRERQAADMLGTSMSADEITGLLAKAPKGAAAADPMLAALAAADNPDLGSGAADEPAAKQKSTDDLWADLWSKPSQNR